MAEPVDLGIEERPQKRARLSPTPPPTSAANPSEPLLPEVPLSQAAPTAPIASTTGADTDLEREIRAGITKYVCPDNLGFTGVLKQRYTDFLVNEILPSGEVLHLRRIGVERKTGGRDGGVKKVKVEEEKKKEEGKEKENEVEMKDSEKEGGEEKAIVNEETTADSKPEDKVDLRVSEDDMKALHSVFGEDATSQIVALVKSMRKHPHWKAKDFTAVTGPIISDKDKRTSAHQTLRRIFPNMLESSMEPDQSIRIKARPPADRGNKRKRGNDRDRDDRGPERHRGQLAWEELGGEYLYFTLYKENKDTMEVVGFLGSMTGGGPKSYGFAGTKDRRACTVQRVCVKRQTAERMSAINKKLFNAAIGDFEYKYHDIGLGDLKGNEFVISLRDAHFEKEDGLEFAQRMQLAKDVLSQAVKDFSEKGFINYYGLQRFGSFSASTDAIGIKLLQGNLQGAVLDILAYSDVALAAAEATTTEPQILVSQDDKARAKALHAWRLDQNGNEALRLLPKKFAAERNIIQHLSSKNSRTNRRDRMQDWQGALMTIPRNLRLMYVHAYQSLVWNVVAGKRWTTYGDKVVEGDLVLVHEHLDKQNGGKEEVKEETIDQDGEIIINPKGSESTNRAPSDDFERARPLSKAEAESGKYSIFDIVLPQPGFDVEYPANAIGDFYKEFMGSEIGGGLDPHNMRRGWREVSLSGGYRKLLARPLQPIAFEIKEYAKADEQLVETDLQRLRKQEGTDKPAKESSNGHTEQDDVEHKKIAVILKMQLASSQYATMALRELMKAGGVKAFKPEFMGGR